MKTMRRILLLALALALTSGDVLGQTSPRTTYIASVGGQATTAAITLSIEASATQGFKLVGWCVGSSAATAAAAVTVTIQRRTTVSSSGTQLTNEGTGSTAISTLNPGHPVFPGIARLNGTPGSGGAVLDQVGFQVGVIASTPGPQPFCKTYFNATGIPMPEVLAGVANGLSINVSSAGSGGLAAGSIAAIVTVE